MKLDTTLPERPGLLHAVPVFDIFALLLLSFLLGPSFVLQSGVRVDPPPSRFQLERFDESIVVTLLTGAVDAEPVIYLGREPVDRAMLAQRLAQWHDDGAATTTMVLLKSDSRTPVGAEREIAEIILGAGFRLALVGRQADEPTETPQAPAEPPVEDDG